MKIVPSCDQNSLLCSSWPPSFGGFGEGAGFHLLTEIDDFEFVFARIRGSTFCLWPSAHLSDESMCLPSPAESGIISKPKVPKSDDCMQIARLSYPHLKSFRNTTKSA